jgi:TBCC domain-containing protein 1
MVDETLDPPPATPPPTAASSPLLRPRRVAFEYGLLPIPKLIFPDGALAQTLSQLKEKLAPAAAASGDGRVGSAALAEALQIPPDQAALALGMLAVVLPAEDPVLGAGGSGGADLRDVLLFLYIQSYKRLVPRPHKDSPAVADVWPSTSAFDGYLSALSPIQVRTRAPLILNFASRIGYNRIE